MPRRSAVLAVLGVLLAGCAAAGRGLPGPHPRPPAPSTGAPPSVADGAVTGYHGGGSRAGDYRGPASVRTLRVAWRTRLPGAVYAQPLLVAGVLVVATELDSVYGLDPRTGHVVWSSGPFGSPVPRSSLPCGNIDPLGITGTPVFDPATGDVLAVAEVGRPRGVAHLLVALDPATGAVRFTRPVDPPHQDPRVEQQRGALAVLGGRVYLPFGGLDGDCGDYHGYVVSAPAAKPGPLRVFRTRRQGGIWAPPGVVLDGNGHLYVSVGNGAATSGAWDGSDSVLELSARLQVLSGFAPASWPADNATDSDLGSTGPTLLAARGGGPGAVFADGKNGVGYVLRAGALGGVGGQLAEQAQCVAFGGTAVAGDVVLLPCTTGVEALVVGSDGGTRGLWRSSAADGSPVVAGGTVLALSGTALHALSLRTGRPWAAVAVGRVSRFATPVPAGNLVYVGTLGGVTAVAAG